MCRASDTFLYTNTSSHPLRITSIYVHFPCQGPHGPPFPNSLTLVYLPRLNEDELNINGAKIRSDSPVFVTLYRLVKDGDDGVGYGCRDKVRSREGLLFEVYLGKEKLLKGTFRKEEEGKGWKVECRCVMEREAVERGGDVAEVLVGLEVGNGVATIRETVRMIVRSRRRRGIGFRNLLEEIPEESEAKGDNACVSDDCRCFYRGWEEYEEVNTEGLKWEVDVGIWVFCLGVVVLFSRASSKKLRKRTLR